MQGTQSALADGPAGPDPKLVSPHALTPPVRAYMVQRCTARDALCTRPWTLLALLRRFLGQFGYQLAVLSLERFGLSFILRRFLHGS